MYIVQALHVQQLRLPASLQGHSICGLTRGEHRGRITSLDLLASLFSMHPRISLAFLATKAHCWLMVTLLSTRIHMSSAELLSSRSAPSLY